MFKQLEVDCKICGYKIPSNLINGHMLVDLGWHFNYEVSDDTDSQSYWLIRFWFPGALGTCRYAKDISTTPYIVHFEDFKNQFHKFQDMYLIVLTILERHSNGLS